MAVHFHNFGRANLAVCDALEAAEVNEQSVPSFPLALRYQQAARRQFKQDLSQLRKLQKERRLAEIGFASQTASEAPTALPAEPRNPRAEAVKADPAPAKQPAPAAQHPVETQKPTESHRFIPSQAASRAV